MENHHFKWENPLLMAIFNSYVSLPEGKYIVVFQSNKMIQEWIFDRPVKALPNKNMNDENI